MNGIVDLPRPVEPLLESVAPSAAGGEVKQLPQVAASSSQPEFVSTELWQDDNGVRLLMHVPRLAPIDEYHPAVVNAWDSKRAEELGLCPPKPLPPPPQSWMSWGSFGLLECAVIGRVGLVAFFLPRFPSSHQLYNIILRITTSSTYSTAKCAYLCLSARTCACR